MRHRWQCQWLVLKSVRLMAASVKRTEMTPIYQQCETNILLLYNRNGALYFLSDRKKCSRAAFGYSCAGIRSKFVFLCQFLNWIQMKFTMKSKMIYLKTPQPFDINDAQHHFECFYAPRTIAKCITSEQHQQSVYHYQSQLLKGDHEIELYSVS